METVELDALTIGRKTLDARSPWFRVKGERGVYQFLKLVDRNTATRSRPYVVALNPAGNVVALNIGKAYTTRGIKVRQRVLTPCRKPT